MMMYGFSDDCSFYIVEEEKERQYQPINLPDGNTVDYLRSINELFDDDDDDDDDDDCDLRSLTKLINVTQWYSITQRYVLTDMD